MHSRPHLLRLHLTHQQQLQLQTAINQVILHQLPVLLHLNIITTPTTLLPLLQRLSLILLLLLLRQSLPYYHLELTTTLIIVVTTTASTNSNTDLEIQKEILEEFAPDWSKKLKSNEEGIFILQRKPEIVDLRTQLAKFERKSFDEKMK